MPEILNIGYDLEEVRRFEKYVKQPEVWETLLMDVFSPEERKINFGHTDPARSFTLCFCFKEALSKALGKTWMNAGMGWQEMELLLDPDGEFSKFATRLSGEVLEEYHRQGGQEIRCSLKSDKDFASCEIVIYR